MDVVLATSNPGKVHEARAILAGSDIRIQASPLWFGEVETGVSFEENARLKAAAAYRMVNRAVLAEDAGIEVDALGGLPGIHSARFAGPSATAGDNNAKVLRLLDGVPDPRTARYRAVVILRLPTGREIVGEGVMEGRLISIPRGEGGFGYDPLFVPEGDERTVAEMRDAEKNEISHRAKAIRAVLAALRS